MSKSSWIGIIALLGSLAASAAKPLPHEIYVDSLRKAHAKKSMVLVEDSVRLDTHFESGSLGTANWLYADTTQQGVTHVYQIVSRSDPKNPYDSTYQTSGRWFHFRMVGVKGKTIHLLFENTDPAAPVYSYDGVHFERLADWGPYRTRQRFDRDTVYVAYCVPYTHDRLAQKIEQWRQSPYLQSVEVAGFSEQNRPIYLLTVRDRSVVESAKKQLYIHARAHPSETPSSWLLEGFVDALLGSDLLKHISCYIVPMTNPDGVAGGFSRSNAVGVDVESNFANSPSPTQSETKTILRLTDPLELDLALNLHAQIAPKMMFWIHTAASTSGAYYDKEMSFFHTVATHNPLLNRADSTYSNLHQKTIERCFWERGAGRTLALTLEESYSHYNTTPEIQANPEQWVRSGERLLGAIGDFLLQPDAAKVFIKAYPKMILGYANDSLVLANGKQAPYTEIEAQSLATPYVKGLLTTPPTHDPGRIRSQALLQAMYGASPQEVEASLVTIDWCPKLFNKRAKLRVTTKNNVHLALQRISDELQEHPEWEQYLTVSGSYNWRVVQKTTRLSPHSYGIAVDIGGENGYYWLWDHPSATEASKLPYRNVMPEGIVEVFEKHGFIWGGKWQHYDTMHFEYRPELLAD